jgi:hypothetical protein
MLLIVEMTKIYAVYILQEAQIIKLVLLNIQTA